MDSSPSNTPPSNVVGDLLSDVAELRQMLRAIIKLPLPATEKQVKDLVEQAERERELVVQDFSSKVEQLLLGRAEEHEQAIKLIKAEFISQIDQSSQAMKKDLRVREDNIGLVIGRMEKVVEQVGAAADGVPKSVGVRGDVYGFTNDISVKIFVGVSLAVGVVLGVMLAVLLRGGVSKDVFDEMRVEAEKSRVEAAANLVQNVGLGETGEFLQGQIKRYIAKHPKAAADFPPERR